MIVEKPMNIFDTNCDVLVNTVNMKGVMGKGLALQFKLKFPDYYKDYRKALREKRLVLRVERVGRKIVKVLELKPHIYKTKYRGKDILILSLPTKIEWWLPSDYKLVEANLKWLRENYKLLEQKLGRKINCIAMPLLGAGLGGLDKQKVRELTYRYLDDLPITILLVYLPYRY